MYWWIALLTHPQQPGICFIFSFSFHWALQQKLELSNLILLDKVEGEAIITLDPIATICMMFLGPDQGWDAYIHSELKVRSGDRFYWEHGCNLCANFYRGWGFYIKDKYSAIDFFRIFVGLLCILKILLNTLYLWYWQTIKKWEILFLNTSDTKSWY